MVYKASLDRLAYNEKEPQKPRQNFDKRMRISEWVVPGGEHVVRVRKTGEPPAWWDDDEEASQSFLSVMGVNLG